MTSDRSSSEDTKVERPNRIEVCGGIAAGKTTLARVMKHAGHNAVFENFRLNPFIEKFYSAPSFYSFETEISFLLQHYSQIKTEGELKGGVFCDYSLALDCAYAQVTLTQAQLEIFRVVHQGVTSEVGAPGLLIHLRCAPTTQLRRIRERNRVMENSISLAYLDSINCALEELVKPTSWNGRILEIDSERF